MTSSSISAQTDPSAASPYLRLILRDLLASVLLVAALALTVSLLLPPAQAQEKTELRIGYQKPASLFVLQKAQGTLEKRLKPLQASVKWG